MAVQFIYPVRVNQPVKLGVYTFTESNTGEPIDLTAQFVAVSVNCEIKRIGDVYDAGTDVLTGAFVTAAAGTVQVASYTFTQIGQWSYQFYCTDSGGNKLWGEPVVFQVVKNTENLQQYEQINP